MDRMPVTSDMTILRLNPQHPDRATLDQAAEILINGGLVVAPTETRYGLLARADRADSLKRLFDAKGRSVLQPTSVFVSNLADVGRYALVTVNAHALAASFLPGPLTLVLNATVQWDAPLVVKGKIGFRISSSPVIAYLVGAVGAPLTATSANRSGEGDLATVGEIQAVLGDQIDLYLDGGPLLNDTSTVVDAAGDAMVILREGGIPATAINQAVRR
jgi:L-threonylcarbamoyladenylate synthase